MVQKINFIKFKLKKMLLCEVASLRSTS